MAREEFEDDSDEYQEKAHERVVSKSFKKGLGLGMGLFAALIVILLLMSAATYLAISGGYLTMEELYTFFSLQ